MNKTKAVLCALNSKYIHTNLAVRYIKAYADVHCKSTESVIVEDTINSNPSDILQKIVDISPNIAAFSCYIWNIKQVLDLCKQLKSQNPDIIVVLGGPEVSFNPKDYLENSYIDYVVCGDGEKGVSALFDYISQEGTFPDNLGICCKDIISAPYCEKNLNCIESPYTDEYLSAVDGRIAYIESTRGCPFSCAFCLSGSGNGVRFFDEAFIKDAILKLWKSGAKTVKFIDRTFNANKAHAEMIIGFILENYKMMPKVCFHFEISADILADSTTKLLSFAPEGLFQIEAGLQSFNHHTLEAVSRKADTDKICENVSKIISFGNIHTHIDLIAGLPYENFDSFRESFNKAYALQAHTLQLGFLKLLYGSKLRAESERHGFVYSENPPYEIISTNWLTVKDLEKLRKVEDANEKISNSGRFTTSLAYVLEKSAISPFDLFLGFGKNNPMPLDDYTSLVFEYFSGLKNVDKTVLRDKMCCDRLVSNKSGRLPKCLQIEDKKLADITYRLETNPDTAPKKGVKRLVCILYSENKVVYADYDGRMETPKLNFIDIEKI